MTPGILLSFFFLLHLVQYGFEPRSNHGSLDIFGVGEGGSYLFAAGEF